MEMYPILYDYTDERFMIDEYGQFITYATEALARADYPDRNPLERKGIKDTTPQWYIPTKAGDVNGQYGKFLTLSATSGDATPIVENTKRATDTESHDLATNGECAYPEHVWGKDSHEDCERGFHEYIKWFLGEDVISLEEWETDYDSLPVEAWIYDTRTVNTEGWVYWGMALVPQKSTSNLLETVQLIRQPDDNFYYALHVDMEAVSLDELTRSDAPKWTGMPLEIKTMLTTPIVDDVSMELPAEFTTAVRGESISLKEMVSITSFNGASQTLNWTIAEDTDISGFSAFGAGKTSTDGGSFITQDGVLTIGRGETAAALKVTAASAVNPLKYASIKIPLSGTITLLTEVAVSGTVVSRGDTLTMEAEIIETNLPEEDKGVTWKVSGSNPAGSSTINANTGALSVGTSETSQALTVTATSIYDSSKSATATVHVRQVTGITVSDKIAKRNSANAMAATVAVVNGAPQTVSWKVSGSSPAVSSTIDANTGILTVGASETSEELTVTATSTYDGSKSSTATVYVEQIGGVTVDGATVLRNTTHTMTAAVEGGTLGFTWTVSGSSPAGSSTININTGELNVGTNETSQELTVTATSKDDTSKKGSAIVKVGQVTGITVNDRIAQRNKMYTMAATVSVVSSAPQTVTWAVSGSNPVGSSTINASTGELSIGSNETSEALTVTATSTYDSSKSATATVSVEQVGGVTVGGALVQRDSTYTMTAEVTGVVSGFTWAVSGSTPVGSSTIVASTGILTIGANETSRELTVTATSTYDTSKKGSAIVKVGQVTGVTVSPSVLNMVKGQSQTITPTVSVVNGAATTVTWELYGKTSAATKFTGNSLAIGSDEEASMFMVRAVSTYDGTKYGEAVVNVSQIGITVADRYMDSGTSITSQTATIKVESGTAPSVTWSLAGGHTSSGTQITNASTGALVVGKDEEAYSFKVRATSVDDATVYGEGTVYVRRIVSASLSPGTVSVEAGDTQSFAANAIVVNGLAVAANNWTWEIIEAPTSSGTVISQRGVLAIGADEEATTLTVKATSTITTGISAEAIVTVSSGGIAAWPGNLTGIAADIGKKFVADGYVWRVLSVDANGNMLVTTTSLLDGDVEAGLGADGRTQFNATTADGNVYTTSLLKTAVMDPFYSRLSDLAGYVQPVDIKTEDGSEYVSVVAGVVSANGLSVVDETKVPAAFPLSASEINKYFAGAGDSVMSYKGAAANYWLRTPYTSSAVASAVNYAGVGNNYVNSSYFARPALWVHP